MRERNDSVRLKTVLGTAALATGLALFAGTPSARPDDNCQERMARADHRLHEAIEHHGPESRQAEHARHELHEAREYCWNHNHRWWNEDERRWHTDRDWDDRDHDHPH